MRDAGMLVIDFAVEGAVKSEEFKLMKQDEAR